MIRFTIDPTLVADAVAEGRTLIVEVRSPEHHRCILGPPSKHRERPALAKKAA